MMLYKTLYAYFPVVDSFSRRELPKRIAITLGHRVMKIREFFQAAEARRKLLVEKHGKRTEDGGRLVVSGGRVEMRDQQAFDDEWNDMLDSAVEDYPSFPKRLNGDDLPDDVTPFEVEALLRLGLLDTPEVWD